MVLVRVYGAGGPIGQGSGFVHPDGSHVVTNQHVVDGARSVRVRFQNGEWEPARIRGTDVYSDLAVLATETPSTATALSLVDREPPVGTEVVALVDEGEYEHAFMSVRLIEVTPALARANDLDAARGVLVAEVLPDGPAAGTLRGSDDEATAFGQRVPVGGDVILALDGTPTPTQAALASYLAIRTSPGDRLTVTVLRDGRERRLSLELGARPLPS